MKDVLIIGAGVVGGMVARALSRYRLSVAIVEREGDAAMADRLLAAGADPRAADWQGDTAVPQPKPSAAPKKPLRERLAEILNEK